MNNCNSLIPGLHKGRPSYTRSLPPLKRKHPALQQKKFINFFLFLWVFFARPDSAPHSQCGSVSSKPKSRRKCGSMRIRIRNTELNIVKSKKQSTNQAVLCFHLSIWLQLLHVDPDQGYLLKRMLNDFEKPKPHLAEPLLICLDSLEDKAFLLRQWRISGVGALIAGDHHRFIHFQSSPPPPSTFFFLNLICSNCK